LALDNFEPPASFWEITDQIRSKPVRLGGPFTTSCSSPEDEGCVRFDQAYPVFRTPFQFVDNTPFAANNPGCGYPWITPDGTDLFCNAGSISALAMIGQNTAGTLQHIDAPVQTTQQRYCQKTEDTPLAPCASCTLEALGTAACSPRGTDDTHCGGNAQTTLGSQRVTSIGAASGPWKIRPSVNGEVTRFPLMHRTPSLLMMSRNSALGAFGLDATAQAASFLYFEVATDAAVDPDFLAFFHMNEAIVPVSPGKRNNLAPFGDANGLRAERTADAGGHGFVGTLNSCAQFPFDRFGRIEHRTNAPPNPGFVGRSIYFQWPDGKVDVASSQATHRLLEGRGAMTLELAVKPLRLPTTMGKIVLLSAPGSFELSFARTQGTSGVVTNVTFEAANASASVVFPNIDIPSNDTAPYTGPYTHLTLTYEGSATANQASVKLYRNGQFAGSGILTGANSLPSRQSGAAPLCIGPGCGTGGSCTPSTDSLRPELLIDEVGISAVVRSNEYIAAAAAVEGPTDVFVPSEVPSWFPSLPLSHESTDIRIPKVIADEINASTNKPQKFARIAALGEALFIDDVLSVNPTGNNVCGGRTQGRTCSFCHSPENHFANPGVRFDMGVDNIALSTNTPSLLNRVFSTRQLKDRSEQTLVHQAERVIEHPTEMHGNLAKVVACLNRTNSPEPMPDGHPPANIANYRQWFNYAFAESSSINNPVTKEQVLIALATYELTLVSGGSVVDSLITLGSGANSIMADGLRLFQGKGRCAGCHSGANFTDELPHATTFGGKALKTPTLRDVAETHPHFHDGSKANLRAVIEHYNRCGAVKLSADSDPNVVWSGCAPELVALGLTDPEINALIVFLHGLSTPIP
jgi:cytochrome c peroxidase